MFEVVVVVGPYVGPRGGEKVGTVLQDEWCRTGKLQGGRRDEEREGSFFEGNVVEQMSSVEGGTLEPLSDTDDLWEVFQTH